MSFLVRRPLKVRSDRSPVLTVVVDTEEEFDWSAPFDALESKTSNIALQPLAQAILEHHGAVPTYVVDYPVASAALGRDALAKCAADGRCEIGAHLHPWVTPPHTGPVDNKNSFPGNLPADLERAKLSILTRCITEQFGRAPTIYKAGRYGIGPNTSRILHDLGYKIDVSIVPYTDFSPYMGPDFSRYSDMPFCTDYDLLEMPLSVTFVGLAARFGPTLYPLALRPLGRLLQIPGILSRLGILERLRLSPEGHTLADLQRQTRAGIGRGQKHFMLTYHSSSLLPGATSYVRTAEDLEKFLATLDRYLRFFRDECRGRMMSVSQVAHELEAG